MAEVKISESIVYIGADDKDIDLFESQYDVPNGMAYNSYAILDDKVCIMDTADKRVSDVWLANVKKALGGRKADYLVVQHVEPDHSGNIAKLMEEYPDMKVVGNAKTFTMLGQFFDIPGIGSRSVIVKEGDTLELGSHTLKFFMTPMVHWPEVMMTFEISEGAFFSADAFGKFGTLDTDEDWACEARRYYFNIVGKYGAQVQAVLKKAAALDIKMILPLHGPILTENLDYYVGLYNTWSSYEPENKGIFIACASIHGNTLAAAEKLKEMLEARGAEKVSLSDITRDDQAEAVEDAFRYDRLVLMSSSYDGGVFPPMEELLMHLRDKTYRNRKVAIVENGSWAPSAARVIKGYVEKFKDITLIEPVVTIKSALNAESEKALAELADALTAE
ncbi:FprA family A-type flavoprotein [Ruminococcus albus]|uniref:F420H2 oxidase n=1 Tax=Ruminococcus albus (strain ATCC 27210 / DSM 20455 / JCM 14654 / NCDO 2250 / 7) TaxID=697329 RepID=E6UH07_RUMA7|nr:FprA family A-type flavoprotein [Ruminococcus albus]ADU21999.1 F420H2 oxidase [Ruminococcus albus 7 = DSM 20455]